MAFIYSKSANYFDWELFSNSENCCNHSLFHNYLSPQNVILISFEISLSLKSLYVFTHKCSANFQANLGIQTHRTIIVPTSLSAHLEKFW